MSLFLMRAYRTTTPVGFIYWQVEGTPDTEGSYSPVPAGELEDILVVAVYPKEGTDVTFTVIAAESVAAGNFVSITPAGLGQKADVTVAGKYPSVGICIVGSALGGFPITVQSVGPTSVLTGLTPGATYYLGTTGEAVLAVPEGALATQAVAQALTATAALVLVPSLIIETPV